MSIGSKRMDLEQIFNLPLCFLLKGGKKKPWFITEYFALSLLGCTGWESKNDIAVEYLKVKSLRSRNTMQIYWVYFKHLHGGNSVWKCFLAKRNNTVIKPGFNQLPFKQYYSNSRYNITSLMAVGGNIILNKERFPHIPFYSFFFWWSRWIIKDTKIFKVDLSWFKKQQRKSAKKHFKRGIHRFRTIMFTSNIVLINMFSLEHW